jgi:hypothetical protein
MLMVQSHALIHLIGPLVAESSRIDSVRVQHIRSLWLRITREDGLARSSLHGFNIFRARYTYVNLIQVSSLPCERADRAAPPRFTLPSKF